jgi:formylmethanofuran dehydrogenase subunit A
LPGTLSIDAGIHNSYPLQYEIRESGLDSDPSRYGWMMAKEPRDAARICLSNISPPLGDICRIPWVITWMIEREQRPESIDKALDGRVFDLSEIARLTRLEPARQLGFNELGHLKTGAAANVVIYDLEPRKSSRQIAEALSNCWCLIKEGVVIRDKGSFINVSPPSKIRYRKMDTDLAILKQTALLQNPTLRLENLLIRDKINL